VPPPAVKTASDVTLLVVAAAVGLGVIALVVWVARRRA
jgi:hypothetical protein